MVSQLDKYHTITINITNQCNLKCEYCYVKNKGHNHISLERLKEIVSYEAAQAEQINFHFIGGEPLIDFENIAAIYEYIKEREINLGMLSVITNGTLLTDEILEWFNQKEDTLLILSYDGNPEVQNYYRDHSYTQIQLGKYLNEYKYPQINMTVSPMGVPTLARDIIHMHTINPTIMIRCNRVVGIPFDLDLVPVFQEQLNQIAEYYRTHSGVNWCSYFLPEALLDINKQKYCCESEDYHKGLLRAYDSDGVTYASCNYLLPMVGVMTTEQREAIKNSYPVIPGQCQDCDLKYQCCSCVAHNYQMTGDPLTVDLSDCEFRLVEYGVLLEWAKEVGYGDSE